jgi:hypothetical protein
MLRNPIVGQLLPMSRADGADLLVWDAKLRGVVQDWVDVQVRLGGLASELAETLYQLLLQLIGQVVLSPEDNDTPLSN